jgi:hypothetical protein
MMLSIRAAPLDIVVEHRYAVSMQTRWRALLRLAAFFGCIKGLVIAVTHGGINAAIGPATALAGSVADLHVRVLLPARLTVIAWVGVICLGLSLAGSKLPRSAQRLLARPLDWLCGVGLAIAGSALIVELLRQRSSSGSCV